MPTLHSQAGRSLGEPPSQLLPTLAFASSFYIHPLLPLPASLSHSLLLNKLNLVSMLFSCPPESTSITPTEHCFTAETLAPTGTPDLVTPPSSTDLTHKTLWPTPEPPLHDSYCCMWARMTTSVNHGPSGASETHALLQTQACHCPWSIQAVIPGSKRMTGREVEW